MRLVSALICLLFCAMLGLSAPVAAQDQADLQTLEQQASAGKPDAQYELALRYSTGDGVLQNHARAVELLERAANGGHMAAQNRLAQHFYNGLGVSQDQQVALEWFAKAAASGQAQFQADYAVALQAEGRAEEAAEQYRLAADQGHQDAQVSLGVLYLNGDGVPKDTERAAALFEAPAQAGLARAQNNLGLLYVRGDGVSQDYERAALLFQLAAEQGLRIAMTNLAVLYENGFGVPLDAAKAQELYQMGRAAGPAVEAEVTMPLYDPRLVLPETNSAELQQALIAAAELGDPVAQFQLGWLLLGSEQATPEDQILAATLMRGAAESGMAIAMANLGWMYFEGIGLPQDFVIGHMWMLLASLSGSEQIRGLNAQLSQGLLPSQIAEAEKRAETYLRTKR
ncbi:MAG: SEL1-like repeat protein [Thalassovita sp.]